MRLASISIFLLLAVGCAQGEEPPGFSAGDAGTKKDTAATGDSGEGDDTTPGSETTPGDDTGPCSPPAGSPCAVFPQCGCAAGQNCNVTNTSGKTSCVAAGSDGLHDACTASGECQKGMQCIAGLCVPFCNSDSDCTISGSPRCKAVQYLPTGSTTPADVPGLKICLSQCDVLNPTTVCGPNTSCFFPYLSDDTTECTAAGTSTVKGGCASSSFSCAPGYTCVNDGDCFKWCRIGFPGDCPAGRTCTGFMTPIMKAAVEYGVCAY